MKKTILKTLFLLALCQGATTQSVDESAIRQFYDKALTDGKSYSMLEYLTTKIGARLSGSPGAAAAVEWSRREMENFGFDSVWLQPVRVPQWVRGQKETGRILNSKKKGGQLVNVCALGGSIGTGPKGITASVVEVKNFETLEQLGKKNIEGKIVFF